MDGRRLSTIPARAIGDQRLTLGHLRLLGRLGMHIDREGWCRVRQEVLGETIGMARETVNRRLKDLVEWAYVAKWSDDASGRSIFYRVLLDTPFAPAAGDVDGPDELGTIGDAASHAADAELPLALPSSPIRVPASANLNAKASSGPVTPTSQVAQSGLYPTCDPHVTSGVTSSDHTRCDVPPSHITSSLTSSSTDSPPPPRRRGARGGGIDELLAKVIAAKPGRVRPVEALLGPIVRQRRFLAPDPAYALGVLADWSKLQGLDDDDCAAVIEALKDGRGLAVKQSDIEAAVKARARATEARRRTEAEAARRAGSEREALARLAPGSEPGAAPPRLDALALRRAVVTTAVAGADIDATWLADLIVIDRTTPLLRLAVRDPFAARHVGSSQLHHVLLAAARTLWPQVELVECVTHAQAARGRAA